MDVFYFINHLGGACHETTKYSLRHIKWFNFKELLNGLVLLFSDCFGLRPFVLNGVKVWWICWQIFKRMSGLCDCILNILPFVKGRVIHDHNWCWREFWQQILYRPAEKSICINIAFEQSHRQKTFADQRADHINAASGMPIKHTVTPLANGRIPMCSWHIVSKTTLVTIDDDAVLSFIRLNRLLEGVPFVFVRFGMPQCFFYIAKLK